ncbi:MAG TPA: DNA recombination protein RmuC [Gammaproteobacteria bacterium]|nr:DNA recombination protein RmuC [Gammaproteobacteria bacterium]
MDTANLILLLIVALLAATAGALVGRLRAQRHLSSLREENIRLQTQLEAERLAHGERSAAFEQARQALSDNFNALAGAALKHNSTEFLKLAQENLKAFQVHAQGDLLQREKAVENLVKPIREALDRTEQQMHHLEQERKEAHGALSKHLETMAESHRLLQGETRNLVQALRRPEVRGQWGEMTLKRLAELAGMVEHCDFYEQEQVQTESGPLRPDMIVRMPDGREIIVDAKTPLDAYLTAVEAKTDAERDQALVHHARKVRERVRELSAKAYWQQFRNAPDFVVLFIPGDQFLSAALERDRALLEDALAARVILATPTSFVALLRAVAYGWRQEALAENAEQIRVLGEEMYSRLGTFAEHLSRVGKSLDSSVSAYNKAVGSFDTRILPSARKFSEMGIRHKKPMEEPQPLERSPRPLQTDADEAQPTPEP